MLGESLKIEVWRKGMIGFCFDLLLFFLFRRISSIVFFLLEFKLQNRAKFPRKNDQ